MTIQNGLVGPGYRGGGVSIAAGASVTIDTVVLTGNAASGGSNYGGDIYSAGDVTIVDTTISNSTAVLGGGLYNLGTSTIDNSLIEGNTVTVTGGGIYQGATGSLDLTNVTISGNQSVGNGGGIYVESTVVATNITVTNNDSTSFYSGGVSATSGSFTSTNSIYAGNHSNLGRVDFYGTVSSGGHNIIGSTSGSSGFGGTDQLNTDPLLDALVDNGGPTKTHALLAPSTAIDPAGLSGAPATDARAIARDGTPDIGAYEYVSGGPNVVVVTTSSDLVNGNTSSINALLLNDGGDGISLREAIAAANNTANIGTADVIRFSIPKNDAGHVYYKDDGIAGSLSMISATTLADSSITDFDADYAGFSWYTIDVQSAPPIITGAVSIDATSQSGFDGKPIIELDGTDAGAVDGLSLDAGSDGSTIRGLTINRFGGAGIKLYSSDGNTIVGNWIGMGSDGTTDQGNTTFGINLDRSASNQIGGTTAGARNVISGNDGDGIRITVGSLNNQVLGNYIGTDFTGTVDLGNSGYGILINSAAVSNTIGGTTAGAGNLISGNDTKGIGI